MRMSGRGRGRGGRRCRGGEMGTREGAPRTTAVVGDGDPR